MPNLKEDAMYWLAGLYAGMTPKQIADAMQVHRSYIYKVLDPDFPVSKNLHRKILRLWLDAGSPDPGITVTFDNVEDWRKARATSMEERRKIFRERIDDEG